MSEITVTYFHLEVGHSEDHAFTIHILYVNLKKPVSPFALLTVTPIEAFPKVLFKKRCASS